MLIAVPPEPIASLGDVDFLPGALDLFRRDTWLLRSLLQVFSSLVQGVPGGVVLLVPDPDGEVVMNPTPREKVWQGIAPRVVFKVFAEFDRADLLVTRAELIKRTQERHA